MFPGAPECVLRVGLGGLFLVSSGHMPASLSYRSGCRKLEAGRPTQGEGGTDSGEAGQGSGRCVGEVWSSREQDRLEVEAALAGTVLMRSPSLLLQGPPQDKVISFPSHPALSPQQGVAAPFSMDFQERGPPSLSESAQSAKSSSAQQV